MPNPIMTRKHWEDYQRLLCAERNRASEVSSTDLLEDLCGGFAKAVEGLYEAKKAAKALGFAATEKEIADTINDVYKAQIEACDFLSSNE